MNQWLPSETRNTVKLLAGDGISRAVYRALNQMGSIHFLVVLLAFLALVTSKTKMISEKSILWGPGLENRGALPARYFLLQAVGKRGKK